MSQLDDLLKQASQANASDIHISPNRPAYFRIDGDLQPVGEQPLQQADTEEVVKQLLSTRERSQRLLDKNHQTDFSYALPDGTRFRVNVFYSAGGLSIALRLIPSQIRTIEELNLPPLISHFAEQKQGLVLAVGPAGHGKSTTLAALIDHINQYRQEHIIAIEDPIEYQFTDKKSIIDQREIGQDAVSFPDAIRATLRQDPNVILIGEIRDLDSMHTVLTLAETGHLVFSTLHTNDAAQTIGRIIDSFPAPRQPQIRSQLAEAISGVISQRLLPGIKGDRLPAVEILTASTAIRNAIREDNIHQILGMIQTSGDLGMQTMDSSLKSLIDAGQITAETARPYFSGDNKPEEDK